MLRRGVEAAHAAGWPADAVRSSVASTSVLDDGHPDTESGHVLLERDPILCLAHAERRTYFASAIILIARGLAVSALGRVSVRTPSLNRASALSTWTGTGSATTRMNDP
jgi:hypothetical protein